MDLEVTPLIVLQMYETFVSEPDATFVIRQPHVRDTGDAVNGPGKYANFDRSYGFDRYKKGLMVLRGLSVVGDTHDC